jgi:tRNA-dihydrouridine synthase
MLKLHSGFIQRFDTAVNRHKENREIPPLDYPRVWQLKRDFPHLTMAINGGIKSLDDR